MVDRVRFYTIFKTKFGRFTTSQYKGFEVIFDEWDRQAIHDVLYLGYMLATAWHETAKTMQPIREYGRGKGKPYGSKIKHSGVKYLLPNFLYYGRGLVQLTWFENYALMGRLLGIDLLYNPELACDSKIAVKIMFEGMLMGSSSFGDFTGKCLEMYFNKKTNSPISARKIINGTDKAELIAEYHYKFMDCLTGNDNLKYNQLKYTA
jgi:putative chitinase